MKIAHLSHHIDTGTSVELVETSLRDLVLAEYIGDSLFGFLNGLSREWMYEVRWGAKDPEFGFAERSLGSKLFDLAQLAGGGFGAWRRMKNVASIPVTYEWIREHYPDAGWPWDGSSEDEMTSRAGDKGDVIL